MTEFIKSKGKQYCFPELQTCTYV